MNKELLGPEELSQDRRNILRTSKSNGQQYLMLDLDAALDFDLKKWERNVHTLLMTKWDRWNTDGLAAWLTLEFAGRCSERTIQYALAGLRKKRYLRRTARPIRTANASVWRRGYQVFEVPFTETENFDPDEVTILHVAKYCDGNRPPDYCERVFGTMPGGRRKSDPPREARSEGCKNLHPRKGWGYFLHSSENTSTPPPPVGGQEILDELRVCCKEIQPDRTARSAKRQKGRKSPVKTRKARRKKAKPPVRQFPQLARLHVNLGNYRATPNTEEFMQNLPTQLKAARQALRDLPEENTQPWLDALMANPLVAVAQEVLGIGNWSSKELRSFVKSLGRRLPLQDLLLCWLGMQGCWTCDTVVDMRGRITDRWRPTAPDIRRSLVRPDLIMEVRNWERNVDEVRDNLFTWTSAPLTAMLDGVDLDDASTIETHPLLWTAILASPLPPEECIDADVVALARQTLVPVSAEDMRAWVDEQSARMLCRWNGRFCRGDFETIVGRGICKVIGEWYEFDMVTCSGRQGPRGDYSHAVEARIATLPSF